MAYRWEHTDAALAAQLELEDEGHPGVVEPGHAGGPLHQPGHRRATACRPCAARCTGCAPAPAPR